MDQLPGKSLILEILRNRKNNPLDCLLTLPPVGSMSLLNDSFLGINIVEANGLVIFSVRERVVLPFLKEAFGASSLRTICLVSTSLLGENC